MDSFEACTNAVTARLKDEVAEIKECLRKQQAQLDTIMKHVTVQFPQPPQFPKPTKAFFFLVEHLESKGIGLLKKCHWLRLKAAI